MKKLIVVLMLLSLCVNISAQDNGGSIYSRFGIGDLSKNNNARTMALGAVGTALKTSNYLGSINPASWGGIDYTIFETGMYLKAMNISDNTYSANYSDYSFSGFLFGFPVSKKYGISFVAGILPFTSKEYSIVQNITGTSNDYTQTISGDGGVTKIFFGSSVDLPYGFSFGATFQYYNGMLGSESTFEFVQSSQSADVSLRKESDYRGLGYSLGLISPNLADFSMGLVDDLRFGVTAEMIGVLPTERKLILKSTTGKETTESSVINTEIPNRFSFGASFGIKNLVLLTDYVFQPWTEYRVDGVRSIYLRDSHRIGVGFEYKPSTNRLQSFWEQIAYRGGVSYEQTRNIHSEIGINEYAVNFGFTLPFQVINSVDVGLKAGVRGSQDSNLVQEKFVLAAFTVNLGELWFVRKER